MNEIPQQPEHAYIATPPHKSNNPALLIITIAVVFVFILLGAFLFLSQNSVKTSQISAQITPIPTSTTAQSETQQNPFDQITPTSENPFSSLQSTSNNPYQNPFQ